MKLNRAKFIQHLERVSCSGQVKELVFHGGFAAQALTPDHLLLVDAPGMDGAEELEQEIGVADLGLLVRALRLLPGEGNTGVDVDVSVVNNRLVIDDGERGVQQLITAAPKTIGTRIESSTVEKILGSVPDTEGLPLAKAKLDGVSAAFGLYKADQVEMHVGKGGVVIRVGTDKTHNAKFTLTEEPQPEEYQLAFGAHLIDVFRVVTDFSSAAVILSGPKKPVLVVDGEYQYVLSPRVASADEAAQKGAVRGKGKAAAEEAGEGEASEEEQPAAKKAARKRPARR